MGPAGNGARAVSVGGVTVSDLSLLPWQARAVRGIAGKRVRTAAVSTARSNGKTLLTGWLAARHLLQGPDGAECFVVASSLAQGKIAFRYLAEHLRSLGCDLGKRKKWRYRDSHTEAMLRHVKSGRSVPCRPLVLGDGRGGVAGGTARPAGAGHGGVRSRALGLFGLPSVVVTDHFRRPEVADALDGAVAPGRTWLRRWCSRWGRATAQGRC